MEYSEDDYLQLSGIQHFLFCRRQWALITLEQQWAENLRTVDGQLLHQRVHDPQSHTRRGDVLTVRALKIHSAVLGLSGECDVVEFHRSEDGVPLSGTEGLWLPYPVEYKRGSAKPTAMDEAQLCAQAMCLEEMLCCEIPEGALYYGETRHRQAVPFTADLRQLVRDTTAEMHQLFRRGSTPKVKPTKSCNACSLKELCLPKLLRQHSVASYLRQELEDPS
jgi:CRISPR-associated exonuclease Cas4